MKKKVDCGEMGLRIKEMRGIHNFTREYLAQEAEISSKFLYEVEKGQKGLSSESLLKIANTLSCSCDYLLTGTRLDYGKCEKIVQMLEGADEEEIEKLAQIIAIIRDMPKKGNSNM